MNVPTPTTAPDVQSSLASMGTPTTTPVVGGAGVASAQSSSALTSNMAGGTMTITSGMTTATTPMMLSQINSLPSGSLTGANSGATAGTSPNNLVAAPAPPVGLIAGGVVGGTTLLVLFAGGFAYYQWRKRRRESLESAPYSNYLDTVATGDGGDKNFKGFGSGPIRPQQSDRDDQITRDTPTSNAASVRLARRKSRTFLDPIPALAEPSPTPGGPLTAATPSSAFPPSARPTRAAGGLGSMRPISFLDPVGTFSPLVDTPGASAYPQSAMPNSANPYSYSAVAPPISAAPSTASSALPPIPRNLKSLQQGGAGGRKISFSGVPPSTSSEGSNSMQLDEGNDSIRQNVRQLYESAQGSVNLSSGQQGPPSSQASSQGSSQLFRLPRSRSRSNGGPGPSQLRNAIRNSIASDSGGGGGGEDSYTATLPAAFSSGGGGESTDQGRPRPR
ncbi:hypothetical protein HDU93_003424, partial [Gonapodya sp. JEL0774]